MSTGADVPDIFIKACEAQAKNLATRFSYYTDFRMKKQWKKEGKKCRIPLIQYR